MDWPEGKDFRISPEDVTRAEEAPLYNKLPENEKQYALFTDGSCRIVGKHRRWKAAVWSPLRQVVETAEGDGESQNHRITESYRLEKTFKIIKSNHKPNTTKTTTTPCP
ncbi:hypothetical protein QYF61_017985 [Mycteria americana]|uniref:Uncharacterized protein n=1 Tax=Mycteria americana TaxID=33587 RepID=A0AAN7S4A6_MYCAM|nr:hypothetical protein QYF61_017985 [Mycteria americana]